MDRQLDWSSKINNKPRVVGAKHCKHFMDNYNKVCVHICRASGRKMEKFSVSVNIAAESNVTFILIYEELLQRNLGQYEILTRVKPKSLVRQFKVISSSRLSVYFG